LANLSRSTIDTRTIDADLACSEHLLLHAMQTWSTFRLHNEGTRRMKMRDRVAIVTGGGGIIGKGIVKRFHDEGARVVVVGRTGRKLDAAYDAAGVPEEDRVALVGDVGEEATNKEMVRLALDKFGRLDSIVTCVFWSKVADLPDVTLDEWNKCLAVTLTSTFLAAKHGFPAILETAGRGSLTAISSVHGSHPGGHYSMYAAAKAGLNMLVRGLALDYTARGIRVNGVAPGATGDNPDTWDPTKETGFRGVYLIGRTVRPEEIGSAVMYLSSDEAAAITGQTITVDGGGTVALHDWIAGDITRRAREEA
jgi:NAD(P)-dependent dehydrogenase (short-subunit alcohol dehydrogenase family)